jgi:hypothetical protein
VRVDGDICQRERDIKTDRIGGGVCAGEELKALAAETWVIVEKEFGS